MDHKTFVQNMIADGNPLYPTPFEAWYDRLTAIAAKLKCGYLVGDAESHRAAFDDGLTPLDEILAQIDAIA